MKPDSEARPLFYDSPTLAAPAAKIKRRPSIPADCGPLKGAQDDREGVLPEPRLSALELVERRPPPLLAAVPGGGISPLPFLMGLFFGGTPFRLPAVVMMIPSTIGGFFVWAIP